jgi:hypothetical protein
MKCNQNVLSKKNCSIKQQNIIGTEKNLSKNTQKINIKFINWIEKLKDKKTNNFIDGIEDKINNSICIAKQYSYIKNKQTNYAYKYCFINDQYANIIELFKNNNNLFETFNSTCNVKPYYDLEIEQPNITQNECDILLNLFITKLCEEFKIIFNINLEFIDFIILNSCRENKLSYHVIINNKVYFNNNQDQKKFINYLNFKFEDIKELNWIKNNINVIM